MKALDLRRVLTTIFREKKNQYYLEIITSDPSVYKMNSDIFTAFNFKVVEPKSFIMQKNKNYAPERYTAGFYILIVEIVLDMNPLHSNAARIAFHGKMHFCMPHRSS